MTTFDKTAFLAAIKPKIETVNIDGFGDVGIIQLTVSQVAALRATLKIEGKSDQFGLAMVGASVVDAEGQPVFNETEITQLEQASNEVMDRLVLKALTINGFQKAEAAKNLPATPSVSSA